MNITYNKFLIAFAVITLLGGAYTYFSNDLSIQAADSSLSSTSNVDTTTVSTNDKISQDTAFLYTLTSLTKIKIDTSLFADASFSALNDNTVLLEPSVTGRPNPFAPIVNATFTGAQTSPVITNPPAQVTDKSAVLNGTTDNTQGVSSVYFEYGPTPTLGKITPPAKQSLIGTFGANITGLTSNTAYFFRAAAKINGVLRYGDVISFNTN